jgi:hypothetical protein
MLAIVYGPTMVPLFALTWGLCIHLLGHIMQAIVTRGYIPGLVTSVLLLPYVGIAIADMLQQFSWQQNLFYAISGIMIVALNLVLMHLIFNK